MNIPDITQLIFSYIVYPEYKLLDGLSGLDLYPEVISNPRGRRYIRRAHRIPCSMIWMWFINPNLRVVSHAIKYGPELETFNHEDILKHNSNSECVDLLFNTFCSLDKLCANNLIGYGANASPTELEKYLFDNVTDIIPRLKDPNMLKYWLYGLAKNPSDLVVEYLLKNWIWVVDAMGCRYMYYPAGSDIAYEIYDLTEFAYNRNPLIVRLVANELDKFVRLEPLILMEPYRRFGLNLFQRLFIKCIDELHKNLSTNAINILNKYPEYIAYDKLIQNPNDSVVKMFIDSIDKIDRDWIFINKLGGKIVNIPIALKNPNEKLIKHLIKLGIDPEFLTNCASNPAFFEFDGKVTNHKIKSVIYFIESKPDDTI